MLQALLNVVMPAVVVAGVGMIVARQMQIDRQALSKLVLYAMTPALIVDTLLHTTVDLGDASRLIAAYLVGVVVMGMVAALCALRFEARTRRSVIASVVTGNNGNFGLPIALFAFGESGLQLGLIIFITSVLLTYSLGPALFGSGEGLGQGLRSVARLPILWCAIGALLLRALHIELPLGLDRGIHLLAQATLPIMLLALGLQMGASGWPRITWPVVTATGLRLLAGPVVAFGVALLLGLHGAQLQALVLASSMPTAVNTFMLASEFGADVESVANTVALTTLGSLLTIAVVVTALPLIPGL